MRRLWSAASCREACGALRELLGVPAQDSSTQPSLSAERLSLTSLLTGFREKLVNLPAVRPQANIVIICS